MHTSFHACDSYPALDDATIDLDLDRSRATVIASGRLGPRSAGVLRTMLDALDAVAGPIHVRAEDVDQVSEEFVAAFVEADIRRRHLDVAGFVLETADGPAHNPLRDTPPDEAFERWVGELVFPTATAVQGGG